MTSENFTKQELKDIHKEALKEWMDEKFLLFGKWAMGTFLAALFSAFMYFILTANGWHK